MNQRDDAGGREWNPYELATPVARGPATPPPLSRTPAAGAASPYAAPHAPLRAPRVEGAAVLAERMPRLLAVLIDAAMMAVPAGLLVFAVFRQLRMGAIGVQGLSSGATTAVVLALALLAGLVTWNIVLLVRHGQTVGKRFTGIRIARPDGGKAGFWRIVLMRSLLMTLAQRVLGTLSPLLGLGLVLTDALMIFRDDRRCLHDIVADTIVVEAD